YSDAKRMLSEDVHNPSTDAHFLLDGERRVLSLLQAAVDKRAAAVEGEEALSAALKNWYEQEGSKMALRGRTFYEMSSYVTNNVRSRKAAFAQGDRSLKNLPTFVRRVISRVAYGTTHFEAPANIDDDFSFFVERASPTETGGINSVIINAIKTNIRYRRTSSLTENEVDQAVELLRTHILLELKKAPAQKAALQKDLNIKSSELLDEIKSKHGDALINQPGATIYIRQWGGSLNIPKDAKVSFAIDLVDPNSGIYISDFSIRKDGTWRLNLGRADNRSLKELQQRKVWLERLIDDIKNDRIPFDPEKVKAQAEATVREFNNLIFSSIANIGDDVLRNNWSKFATLAIPRREASIKTPEGLAEYMIAAPQRVTYTGIPIEPEKLSALAELGVPVSTREELLSLYRSLMYFIFDNQAPVENDLEAVAVLANGGNESKAMTTQEIFSGFKDSAKFQELNQSRDPSQKRLALLILTIVNVKDGSNLARAASAALATYQVVEASQLETPGKLNDVAGTIEDIARNLPEVKGLKDYPIWISDLAADRIFKLKNLGEELISLRDQLALPTEVDFNNVFQNIRTVEFIGVHLARILDYVLGGERESSS
ncbi:MAG: hypothetical protein WCH62_09090, partial [Candidatus Omnitrophota bacterium]